MNIFTSIKSANKAAEIRKASVRNSTGRPCQYLVKRAHIVNPDKSVDSGWKVLFWTDSNFSGAL